MLRCPACRAPRRRRDAQCQQCGFDLYPRFRLGGLWQFLLGLGLLAFVAIDATRGLQSPYSLWFLLFGIPSALFGAQQMLRDLWAMRRLRGRTLRHRLENDST